MRVFVKYVIYLVLSLFFVHQIKAQESVEKRNRKQKQKKHIVLPSVSQALLDSIAGNMVWVTGGSFIMGNNNSDIDERPAYEVVIDGFAMSRYPLTQRQWTAIMGYNPSDFPGCDQCPVDNVSWNDAQSFIETLNEITRKKYTLPTEAEWEYAAKGGKEGSWNLKYAGSDDIDSVGWYTGNSARMPHPVGLKKPNALGLYDMSGNVWEWCQDWYAKFYYEQKISNNPTGPASGSGRIRRGGSWFTQASSCKTTTRNNVKQDYFDNIGGFRLAQYPN
ncbi:MAG: formylglycine-generating enzyme family protein [Bacteroidetes bacterium]|nr:formylglycine-generating enzyme family protein [Bacteroidota bacterium]